MKKRILKTMLFLISVTALMFIMIFSASAKTVSYKGFTFDVTSKSATVTEYTGTAEDVKIPSKISGVYVKAIGPEAFWSVKTMKTVSIPSTVTSIGEAAFNECSSLKKVVIPGKVKTIGSGAFWYCTGLKTVVIPKSVTKIGSDAFKGCSSMTAYVISGSYAESYIKSQKNIKLGYRYMSDITLSTSSATVAVNNSQRITFTAKPSTVYYKKVKYTSSNTKVATVSAYGTVKGLSCGTAVIAVKTADGSNITKKCTVKVVPGKVTTLSQSDVTQTSYTLKWKASPGATQYKLYKYNASTKRWQSFKTTDKLYCKVSSLTAETTQQYRIKAFTKVGKTNYYSVLSSTFNASTASLPRPADTTGLKAKPAHNFINLSWNKAEGATGYRIYKYNTETKRYTYLLSTKKLSAKITGLTPSTNYVLAIRTYAMNGDKMIFSKAVSEKVTCFTRPDYVSGFKVQQSTVTHDGFTLQWTKTASASGYIIYCYDSQAGSYQQLCKIVNPDVTSQALESLSPSTTYKFLIRAYVINNGEELFGYTSDSITVETAEKPIGKQDIFNSFIEAYNNSKTSDGNMVLFSESGYDKDSMVAPDVAQSNKDAYNKLISLILSESSDTFYFTNGVEASQNKPLTSFITPYDKPSTLTYDKIVHESLTVEEDGSGYRITFKLKSEDKDAAANSLIANTVNWQIITQNVDLFTLGSCTYEGTVVEAKVRNGMLDEIKFLAPLSISFTLDGNPYNLSVTAQQEYIFIWQ